jgi:hypothetical protein
MLPLGMGVQRRPNPMKGEPFYEHVKEIGPNGLPCSSTIIPATLEQIAEAEALHQLGKCPHTIVYDEDCWPWYARTCYTCGVGRGLL